MSPKAFDDEWQVLTELEYCFCLLPARQGKFCPRWDPLLVLPVSQHVGVYVPQVHRLARHAGEYLHWKLSVLHLEDDFLFIW